LEPFLTSQHTVSLHSQTTASCGLPDRESCLGVAGGYHNLNLDSDRGIPGTGASIASALSDIVLMRRKVSSGLSGKDPIFRGPNLTK